MIRPAGILPLAAAITVVVGHSALADLPLESAVAAMEICDFSGATTQLTTLIDSAKKTDPDLSRALVYRGISHEWLGELQNAVADHSDALALAPGFYEALEHRMYAYDKLGQSALADADLERHGDLALADNQELTKRRVRLERPGGPPQILHFFGERSEGFRGKLVDCTPAGS